MAQSDSHHDLNDDQRHQALQPRKAQHGHRKHNDGKRQHEEHQVGGHGALILKVRSERAVPRNDLLQGHENNFQVQPDAPRADVLQVPV